MIPISPKHRNMIRSLRHVREFRRRLEDDPVLAAVYLKKWLKSDRWMSRKEILHRHELKKAATLTAAVEVLLLAGVVEVKANAGPKKTATLYRLKPARKRRGP